MRDAVSRTESKSTKYLFGNAELAVDVFIRGCVVDIFLICIDRLAEGITGMFGFSKKEKFEADESASKAPTVSFE